MLIVGRTTVLLSAVVLCLSCGGDKPTGSAKEGVIVPLAAGNEWAYRVTTFDPTALAASVSFDTIRVVRDTMIENERWSIIGGPDFLPDVHPVGWTNRTDGLWVASLHSDSRGELTLKFPASVGETYTTGGFWDITIETTNSSVTVPAGHYVAYCYRIDASYSFERLYVAPNVGIIKRDTWVTEGVEEPVIWKTSELLTVSLE